MSAAEAGMCTDRLKRRSKPRHGFLTTHAGHYPQNEPHVKKRGHLEGFWKPSHPQRRTAIFFWIHAWELLAAILLHACACHCLLRRRNRHVLHDNETQARSARQAHCRQDAWMRSFVTSSSTPLTSRGRTPYLLTAISSQHRRV